MRWFPRLAAVAVVALLAAPSPALMIAMRPVPQRAVTAEAVVVGKVTAIENDPVEAAPFAGAPNTVAYKVAVVKIDTPLAGAANMTHLKVGFIPPPPPVKADPNLQPGGIRPGIIRRPGFNPELKVGDEYLLFLAKHPGGAFYMMPNMSPPVDLKAPTAKKEVEQVKAVLAAVADPMKGLKAAKAEDRLLAATALLAKYRAYPEGRGEAEQVPVAADESQLILKALAEADWTKFDPMAPNAQQAFYSLGLTPEDGWAQPKPQPGTNFQATMKTAFVKWVAGPGKTYQVKKFVPKTK